jgi:signal transduction histidine kinase/ActR/RegA family two-component response regulator
MHPRKGRTSGDVGAVLRLLRRDWDAVGLLRVLLVLSIAGPVALFLVASVFTYRAAYQDAEHKLARTTEVAREHALKVFDTHRLVAAQVNELLDGMSDAEIVGNEARLHAALHDLIADLPQIESVLVVGKDGRPLVSADAYPVPHELDFSDRDYFRVLSNSDANVYITRLMNRRLGGAIFFGLAHRRVAADGSFAGVIDISVSPEFFGHFYETMLGEDAAEQAGTVIALVRDDGQLLARYPAMTDDMRRLPPQSPFYQMIAVHPASGSYTGVSTFEQGAPTREFAYRQITGFPVYVTAGRSYESIVDAWFWQMASHLLFGIPATAALFVITLIALRRTQREQDALEQAHEEMQRREAAEEALRQAQKLEALGQLTAGVAHDFNNLLMVILGNLEFIARAHADQPSTMRRLDYMRSAAERGARLTSQLLAFSRRQRLIPQPLNLNSVLPTMVEMLQSTLGRTVEIDTDLQERLWPALVDRTQLELAMLNLGINARDAMDGAGKLTIAARNVTLGAPAQPEDPPAGEYVTVSVADNGPGMTPDVLAHAFEPFFTTKAPGLGSGLGLSQVHGFAHQSGGGVRINTGPDQGTHVQLFLPRAPTAEASQRPARKVSDTTFWPATVLVIDDDADVRAVTAAMLSRMGHVVIEAESGAMAIELLERNEALNAAVIDYAMPGMDGVETARRLRERRPDLPVLFITGFSERAERETRATGDMLLNKPFTAADLADRLNALLHGAADRQTDTVSMPSA